MHGRMTQIPLAVFMMLVSVHNPLFAYELYTIR